MKEEGFLNGAFNLIKTQQIEARWLINQGGFNLRNDNEATPTQIACIAFAVAVHSKAKDSIHGPDESLISQVFAAKTIGDLKAIIDSFDTLQK